MAVRTIPDRTGLDLDEACARARVVAFDLDNTLARSKKPMSPEMGRRISTLTTLIPVAIVTGGSFALIDSQVLAMLTDDADRTHLHLMPTSGTRYYRWSGSDWHREYAHDMNSDDRRNVIAALERHAREQGIWCEHPWGDCIEDRGSQITFSALGQRAPIERKEAWDPDNAKKNRLAEAVGRDFPHLAVHSGGSTSVDVSQRGIDKAYAVRILASLLDTQVGRIIYVGDRMDPDGNDYPAAMAGTIAIRVSGPEDTLRLCDALIAGLSRKAGATI